MERATILHFAGAQIGLHAEHAESVSILGGELDSVIGGQAF